MKKIMILIVLANLLIIGLAANISAAKEVYNLKAFYFGPETASFTKNRWYPYLDAIENASEGKIKFTRMHGFSVLPPSKIYDGLARGIVDLAYVPVAFTPGRFLRTEMLMLPGLARNRLVGGQIVNDLIETHVYKDFPELANVVFDYSGPRTLWMAKKPIRTLEDLKGLRIRAYHEQKKTALTAVGAVFTATPAPERFMAMERGLLDGSIEVSTSAEPFGLQELLRYQVDMNFGSVITVIGFCKKTFEKFSPDLQIKLAKVNRKFAIDYFAEQAKKEDEQLLNEEWPKKYGLKTIKLPDEEKEKWEKIINPIWDQWAAKLESKGLEGNEILSEIIRGQKKYGETPK